MTQIQIDRVQTPIGAVDLMTHGSRLCALAFSDRATGLRSEIQRRYAGAVLQQCDDPEGYSSRLRAYFGGDLNALDDIPVETGGSEFQRRVWLELRRVPFGKTQSYGELARTIGVPGAARAVGAANSRNPVALVIPCHRIVTTGGDAGGYAGGLERKRWLRRHETPVSDRRDSR